MTETGQITNAADALAFMLAGRARVTLKSVRTGQRYTFKISASTDGEVWFAGLLTGPSNEDDYQYTGFIKKVGVLYDNEGAPFDAYELIAGKKGNPTATPFKALYWALERLCRGTIPQELEVWHEGRCGRCGRALTVPESISTGFGPECAGKVGGMS
jgi:hypothetical protein